MKVLIAIPCMDQVPAPFAQSLAMIRKGENEAAVAFQMGSLIYTSRNSLAAKAIEMEADLILWLDSDMVFSPDLLLRLQKRMDEDELDIVTGLYFRRVPPFTPVIFDGLEMTEKGCEWSEFTEIGTDPFEVGGCGFGCVLMKAEVLMNVQGKFGCMFNPLNNMGEDLSFCWRARECGFKIVCDPGIICGHVGYSVINDKFFQSYQDAHTKEEADETESSEAVL